MRIAIASDWFAPRRGGIESQLLELAERLGACGHSVDVITATRGAVSGSHYTMRRLHGVAAPGTDLAVSPLLPRALRRELLRGYDVVHAHVSVVSPVGYTAAAVAGSLRLPTVVTFHSILRHKRLLLRFVDSLTGVSRSAAHWTAVSSVVAEQVHDALRGAEVSVLANGIDCAFWSGTTRVERQDPEPVIVSTTRLNSKKRPMELVRAFVAAVARARVGARLVLVGDGPERRRLEREIAALNAGGSLARVELRGWLGPGELRSLYGRADAFAIASVREAFGIASLEARVAGLPVIAMSAAGSSEFLARDPGALLCHDDRELSESLARFLSDPNLRAALAGAPPPPPTLDRYDWSRVIPAHALAYGRAIARAPAAALAAPSA